MASLKTSDFDDERQPKVAVWPTKPEVLIFPTVW